MNNMRLCVRGIQEQKNAEPDLRGTEEFSSPKLPVSTNILVLPYMEYCSHYDIHIDNNLSSYIISTS